MLFIFLKKSFITQSVAPFFTARTLIMQSWQLSQGLQIPLFTGEG